MQRRQGEPGGGLEVGQAKLVVQAREATRWGVWRGGGGAGRSGGNRPGVAEGCIGRRGGGGGGDNMNKMKLMTDRTVLGGITPRGRIAFPR